MIHLAEIMFKKKPPKLPREGVYEKREIKNMVCWNFQSVRVKIFFIPKLFISLQHIIFHHKTGSMSREQQKYIEIQMLILCYENHSSTKLQIIACMPTVVYMISGNHLQ